MLRTEVWITATLFCAGIIAGMVAVWPDRKPPVLNTPPSVKVVPTPDARTASSPVQRLFGQKLSEEDAAELRRGPSRDLRRDIHSLLRAGGYERAAQLLRNDLDQVSLENPGAAAEKFAWLGVAEELTGRARAASLAYATALKGNSSELAQAIALTGLLRTWIGQGRTGEAVELTTDLYFQSRQAGPASAWLRRELLWILPVAIRDQATQSTAGENNNDVYFLDPELDLEGLLDQFSRLDQELTPQTSGVATGQTVPTDSDEPPTETPAAVPLESLIPAGVTIVQKPADALDLMTVDVNLSAEPILKIIQSLAAEASLMVEAEEDVRGELVGRSRSLLVTGENVAILLDLMLTPLGIGWEQQGSQLLLVRLPAGELQQLHSRTAIRLFNQFSLEYQGDHRLEFAQLNLGNLALLAGHIDEAASHYHAIQQSKPAGELAARLLMNEGLLNNRLGRQTEALERLYRAIDQSLDLELQGDAWAWIAEICLDLGRLDEAILAANRAVKGRSRPDMRRRATILLASAQLVRGDPHSANRLVFDLRDELKGTEAVPLARFLGSLSRIEGAVSLPARQRELPRLIASLAELEQLQVSQVQPSAISWLVSRAWNLVGFDDRAEQSLVGALAIPSSAYWSGRLNWELASLQRKNGRHTEAIATLQKISGEVEEIGRQAMLEIARINLADEKAELAIDEARRVFEFSRDVSERSAALQIMGAAFSTLKQPHMAALCFSGVLPPAGTEPVLTNTDGNAAPPDSSSPPPDGN